MPQGELKILRFRPGLNKNDSEYQSGQPLGANPDDFAGTWVSGDKVRFHDGSPEKIGGWISDSANNGYLGIARAIHTWSDQDIQRYVALGTSEGLFLFRGGTYYDITPVVTSIQFASAFTGVSTSNLVEVSINSHGVETSGAVVFPSAVSVGDITISGRYQVVSATNNTFQIRSSVTSGINFTNDGVSTGYQGLLAPGNISNRVAFGWGRGTWSQGAWGTPISGLGVVVQMRQWSLANWGEDLIACPRNGKIYRWVATSGPNARAVQLSGAPERNFFIRIAEPTRHLVTFGTCLEGGEFDPMAVRWSNNEDLQTWSAAVTNAAGDQILQGGTLIMAAQETKAETIIITDETAHSMQQIPSEPFFRFDKIGDNCGAVSQHCMVEVNGEMFWMGFRSFWRYRGQITELPSALDKAIFDDSRGTSLDFDQKEKVFAGVNSEYSEILWLYPSKNGSREIDRYVIYNYLDDIWYDGTLDRTTWVDVNIFSRPLATGVSAGSLFIHEETVNADGQPLGAFIQSGDFDLGTGTEIMFVDKIIPDMIQSGNVNITLNFKKYPNGSVTTKGPYVVQNTTKFLSPRGRGRTANIRYSTSILGGDFEVGFTRIQVQPDGER
jgi:hypothetical protein